jgi:hypothetical protein
MTFLLVVVIGLALVLVARSAAFKAIFADSDTLTTEAQLASVRLAGWLAFLVLAVLSIWGRIHTTANPGMDYSDPRFDGVVFLQNAPPKIMAALALWVVIVAVGVFTWQVLDNLLAKRAAARADVRLLCAVVLGLAFLFGGVLR